MHIRIGYTLATMMAILAGPSLAAAADLHAVMERTTPTGPGEAAGDVVVSSSPQGVVFKLNLKGLPTGPHGFHVHESGSCGPTTVNGNPVPAGGAGGHWDSDKSGKHEGPQGQGHIGDLPLLEVAADGSAKQSLTATRIKDVATLKGHALVIHAGSDNYSDQPTPLGGGGARIACGVIN